MVRGLRFAILPMLFLAGCATPPAKQPPDPYEAALRQYWDGRMATSRALVAIQELAETGDPRAEYWLALEYLEGRTVRQDDAEGVKWLTRAAEHDNAQAQMRLGYIYRVGLNGVTADQEKARRWFGRAYDLGEQSARHFLIGPEPMTEE